MENLLYFVAGACISIACSVMIRQQFKEYWKFYNFYFLYIIYLFSIILGIWHLTHRPTDTITGWVVIISAIAACVITFFSFRDNRFLKLKNIAPKIIQFTEDAKNDEICLLGGDLNFFGEFDNMDENKQYRQLKEKEFNRILILCQRPKSINVQKRYGKILKDFTDVVEIRYYDNNAADKHIRGRIKWKLGSHIQQALIYQRIDKNRYQVKREDITCDDANLGTPYIYLWSFLWNNAKQMLENEKQNLLNLVK